MTIQYRLSLTDPAAHVFTVQVETPLEHMQVECDAHGQRVKWRLPSWIPGSYLIREFSRNVLDFSVDLNGQRLRSTKSAKDEWVAVVPNGASGTVTATYRVYAWDLSVRGAHFDQHHAFINGTSAYVCPVGMESSKIELTITRPQHCGEGTWQFCCGLNTPEMPLRHGCLDVEPGGSVALEADCYDSLIDHPFEFGQLITAEFMAHGVPHYLAFYGADDDLDVDRLCADLKPVCEAQIALFEPELQKAPFSAYWFMTHASPDGYGGLEHRNSTALLCARKDLPQQEVSKPPEGYETFLGLCSHEYFHAWNVKRMKPAAFVPYRLREENYTRLLWVFEGFTSYYDDLMLARAGKVTEESYLKALSKTISAVLKNPGTGVQSVADSSFDAWTKYYRQDENAPNAIVSYYTKGALVAFCLDVEIRARSNNRYSLDDVMRALWRKHGMGHTGLGEQEFGELIQACTALDLNDVLREWVDGTGDLPLSTQLGRLGLELAADLGDSGVDLGATVQHKPEGMLLKQVLNGETAHSAGLSAGDLVVAVDGTRCTEETFQRVLRRRKPGQRSTVLAFRFERLLQLDLVWQQIKPKKWKIVAAGEQSADTLITKRPWLNESVKN